jgi:hypothetical protein
MRKFGRRTCTCSLRVQFSAQVSGRFLWQIISRNLSNLKNSSIEIEYSNETNQFTVAIRQCISWLFSACICTLIMLIIIIIFEIILSPDAQDFKHAIFNTVQ